MDKVEISNEDKNIQKSDMVSSILFFIFGLVFFLIAFNMPVTSLTGSAKKWYLGPGVFPGFIGLGLMFQAAVLFTASIKKSGGINRDDFNKALAFLKTDTFKRFAIALALLAIYIFVLLGRVKYEIATFLYVFINIFVFRVDKYAIWKILIIAVVSSIVVGYGFSHFARIPLP